MSKKKYIILFITCLLFTCSCNKIKDINNKNLETMVGEAAAFMAADVDNVKITTYRLNIRAGAGTNHTIVGILNENDIVEVVGKIGTWYVIHMPNDLVGCVSSKYAKPIVVDDKPEQIVPYELTSLEQQMVDLINQERTKRNLKPLEVDWEVARVARIKSQDMVDNNYFSHNSPIYGSPFKMLTDFAIKYTYAGENIAANSSVERAHTSLMNSEGHRNNILNSNFTHIGIGIVQSNKYGYIFTQQFISKPR